MKVYPSLNVELTYQNFGTTWLGILRGSPENIELAFNGLFNFGAANGKLEYHNEYAETIATFWTSRKKLGKFFFNQRFFPHAVKHKKSRPIEKNPAYPHSIRFAESQIAELQEYCHEVFVKKNQYMPDAYEAGKLTAENPDDDFKDSVIKEGFKNSDKDVDKNPELE